MTTSGTPTYEGAILDKIAQRERQIQTSFPATVVAYDEATTTVEIEPQYLEAWRDGSHRVVEPADGVTVLNVPVAFPRAGAFRMTYPIAAGDTGLVICTKFSLDLWRDKGEQTDPGDLRRFGMSGAVFFPVNLTPTADVLDATEGEIDSATVISIGTGGTTDFLCWYTETKQNLDDLKTAIDTIKSDYDAHTHLAGAIKDSVAGACSGASAAPASAGSWSYTVTDPKNDKVKVE